jgi:hypothetical protein
MSAVNRDLEEVFKTLTEISRPKLPTGVIKSTEYAQEIEKCKEKLEHSLKSFEVCEIFPFPLIACLTLTVRRSIV